MWISYKNYIFHVLLTIKNVFPSVCVWKRLTKVIFTVLRAKKKNVAIWAIKGPLQSSTILREQWPRTLALVSVNPWSFLNRSVTKSCFLRTWFIPFCQMVLIHSDTTLKSYVGSIWRCHDQFTNSTRLWARALPLKGSSFWRGIAQNLFSLRSSAWRGLPRWKLKKKPNRQQHFDRRIPRLAKRDVAVVLCNGFWIWSSCVWYIGEIKQIYKKNSRVSFENRKCEIYLISYQYNILIISIYHIIVIF